MKKQDIKKLQRMIALTLSLVGGLYSIAWAAPAATALPTGEQDMKNATVTRDTTNPVMTIEQTKGQNRAFISWDTFNIGKDATVNVKQYSGADLLVNAVRGNNMSEIAGKLNATGNVALINPNGVIFMDGAQVNVGGLGVYAAGYDAASSKIINSGKEGSIEIQSGAVINVGVSAALANLSALNIAPSDYAIAIDSSGEDGYTNRIHLVAEGNVEIEGGSTIKARDYTYVGDSASVGAEGFNVGVGAVGMGGKIYIRSDRDADDYGSVIITHGENSSKPVMQSASGVSIYTNAAQVDGDDDTTNGINAAVSRTESGDGATTTYYTKHDYKNGPSYEIDGSSYTDGTSVSVEGPGVTADKLSSSSADNKITTSYGGNGATTITTSLLVNNIDQLQDIEDGTYGNLDGRYVLGRDINATNDEHSYIDDGILYKMTDGTLTKWSTKDGVAITGTKSGGDLSKTVNGTTIGHSKDENKATTTLTGGTILSNSNGTVGAENTQWSTTKGVSTVTDKTAGSTYTIQSDTKSVVDQDGLTSNTSAKTVTDKDNTYTANIGGHTVTHTGDNIVTNTNSHTVTKSAGTSDAGYKATVTDGSATAAGTSGTIAINDITYQVTGGKVGDTVTYGGSSVNTGKNTVTAGGVTTAVTENGTGTDGVKAGTIASDRVTVNGTTTTVTDGTTSYQIITGTDDAVTYTKGTTSASISGTKVSTGEVWVDTSADKVVKGDTTAVITSDTAGSVTYGGQDYAVADGAVSMTDSKTGETVTVTGDEAAKVLLIFSDAKTDLSNAQAIYGDYTTDAAKAQSLTKTLDGAIETLKEVTEKSTAEETVRSNFDKAAAQLKSDTALFGAASTALSNADTALTQYNALQKEISNNTKLEPALKQAYDEFQSSRLDDTTINNIHSDKWDGDKGFNPIGSSDAPFTGKLDGFSGETVFGLYNLTINRPDEDNVGLISVAGASGHAAALSDIHLYSTAITGNKNVGTVAGTLQQGSSLSWSGTAGTVKGTESLGGLVGLVDGSSIWDSSSSATVEGGNKAGGIAGTLQNGGTLTDVRNFGNVSGKEDVGGIAGYVEGGTITGSGSAIYNYANTYNTGTVTGTTNTGGIVGHAKGIYMYGVFNTNEDTPLSTKSQLIIDGDNKVIQRGDGTTGDKDKTITDASLKSSYGKVTGVTNTGGLVGWLDDAPDFKKTVTNINISSTTATNADGKTTKEAVKDAPITNNVIDTSYNAGNITGTGDNTGGLVGSMTGGTLSNVYNADNNTVLREQGTIPDAVRNASITDTSDHSKIYAYNSTAKVSDSNQDLTQYYSFFTVDDSGSCTYYYFLPVKTTSGTTQKGAGGIYVTADGKAAESLPSTKERYYFNRTFNKDANVTGTGKNTGGLVGSMMTTSGTTAVKYSAGSVIDSAYNAGTITGSDTAATGALVGSKDADSLINDSFYVTGKDVTNGKVYSNVDQAVGKSSTDTSKITNTAALDAVESKKKYYVSHDSTRTNFPGAQQKTDTDKDSSGNITATYYEYTSGTKGSFYTDGTGSIASISHIYPITTTGTTDSTGKTTYTSTRSTTAAYTKQADGTFQDASENTYTATYDTATRQIVLTPVSGSTAATVVLNAVLAARTANETWTIYEDQTRPLLTAFLNKASLSRSFSYDGTTHNLKTDDVANLYGRADFDGDAGKDVQLSNYQLSSNGVSSEYTYDNTSIWSPQHGYFMDPESTLVINPVNMSANLYGTRVYGDIFNTRGYYVCVPYIATDGTKHYSFYKPADESSKGDKEGYTLLKDTDSDKALTDFFGKYEQTEDGLLKLAEEKGFYVLELNGFINGEGVNNLGNLITGLVSTLSNSSSTTTTSGSNLQHLFSSVTADTYLDAGIYNVTNAQITGLTATNQNYTINYGGTLTVKQAELYYTYDGSREYGAQNKDGEHTYTLVGVDSKTADSSGKYTSTHGFLKSWNLTDKTITIKNDDGTETTIANPYGNFFKQNGDTYEINQDNIGVTGYTAEKTTTTTDVTTGTSTTVTSKDDTKSASLDDIYANMTGTVNTDSINKPGEDSTTTSKIIGSYGDGAVKDDMYTHVLVDKDGKPLGYKVTSFASTNKDAGGTIQLYFKTSSDTTNAADKNIQAAVNKFNQNYKLVWKEGGTYDKEYTIGNPEQSTDAKDAGIQVGKAADGKGLTVNDSTFTITPKTATVTITGHRAYGDTMDTSSYTTSTGAAASGQDTEANQYNLNINGLTNGDSASVLDTTKTETLLSGIDNTSGTAADAKSGTEINKYTNVLRDGTTKEAVYQNVNGFEKSKVSVVNDVVKDGTATDQMKVKATTTGEGTSTTTSYDNPDSILTSNNYDYILQDGTHQLKITPVDIHVKVEGSKTYGDFTSQAAKDYTASVSGGVTFNGQKTGKVTLKTGEVADIAIANKLDEKSNAGMYTYDSSKSTDGSTAFTISLTDDTANTDKNDYHADNYNISFDTTYTISPAELWYTYEGSRDYGADNTTTANIFKLVGVDNADSNERVRGFLKSWDAKTYGVGTDQTISLTTVGDDKDALYAMSGMADTAANKKDTTTIRSITGSNSDGTYSHVIVDKDGKVIGYNLSSLGLSADDKLSLTDTKKNAAFKNNYKLVWKPQVQVADGKGTIQSKQTTTASVKDATTDAVSTNSARTVDVGASTLTITPVNLTVEVTGKREYGHTMGTKDNVKYNVSNGEDRTSVAADGNGTVNTAGLTNETYNINLDGLKNDDGKTILDDTAVKNLLGGIDAGDSADDKISRYTSVKQSGALATNISYQGEKVYAYDLTKKSGNSDNTGSQITVTGKTEANHYDLLAAGNYDYTLQDGTHTLTIDRHDLNLNITAERQYGDISNQQVVSDYKSDAKASGTVPSYATGITSDTNGLQNGETIDFTKSTVALSDNFAQADAGTYTHNWYNDDTNQSADYSIGNQGITSITLKAGEGSAFDPKNYNIHYTTTYTIDKADLYYTYDGERDYGEDNAAATHTYTIVGKDNDSSKESVRGYLKSWDSSVLAGSSVLKNDLLKVTNEGSGAYTMAGVAIQDADTASKDYAANVTDSETSKSIGKDSGYSHVIVDKDGKILSYTLDTFGTELAGKDAVGTLAKNYNLIWKQGGSSHQLDKVYTADKTASTIDGNGALQAAKDTTNKITVKNSSFKIDPLALTVTVTGQRDYGDTMTTNYKTDGTAGKDAYNIALTGSFANGETAGSVLNEDNVKKMLASLENDAKGDGAATRENSNGKDGKISRYTDVKRKEDNKSQIDSYSLNVGSTDTSSTITLASDVQKDANGKVTSIKHADSKEHGFNVLNDGNYDYVVSEGSHRLTINPVDLTVNVKGESTYGKADTTYTVTSIGAKNGETIVAGSETKSNLAANAAAGSYTADGWTDKTGAATSKAPTQSGKYLDTAALRAGQSSDAGTDTDKGIYQVQLAAGENTDGSGLSTFSANNYNITYHTTQVIHPEKLTIAIDGTKVYGTKVYGSQPTGLTAGNMSITAGKLADDDSLNGLTVADNMDNMGQLTDAGTYRHNWSIYAGGSVPAESYTYTDADGQTHTGDSTAKSWITGVGVSADNKAFDFNNYDVDFQSTYEVTKRPLQLDVTSTSVYGDPKDGYIYTAAALTPAAGVEEGLVSGQQFNPTDISVTDDIKETTDAGTYTHRADGTSYSDAGNQPKETTYKGITAVAADSLKDAGDTGFKSSNYEITLHQGTHVVEKRTVRATVSGSQVYGESAPTSGEAYQVAFDMAGGTDVNAHEGLVGGQSIANSQVTVQNSVGETNDVGTYTTTQSDVGAPIAYGNNPERVEGKDQGIDGLVVSDGTGTNAFKNNNYNIVLEKGSYTVNQRPVTFLTTGSRTYGEENDKVGDYTIKQLNTADGEGLTGRNAGIVTEDKAAVINKTDALTDAGSYGTESDSAQVLDIDDSVQEILGDDYKNYTITYQDQFTINPRTVRVTIEGESTYGDAALTAGRDYKTIDFEQAGADGVAAQKGLVSGQTIDKSQVTVQTDGIGEKTDAGTYHLSQEGGQPGIRGITVTDGNGFKNKNYRIVMDDDSTYTINKRPLTITIRGEKTYGDPTSFSGRDYAVTQSGLQNQETIDFDDARVVHSQETADPFSEAGQYSSRDGKGILGFDSDTLQGDGFKLGNYALTYDTNFIIQKRPVDVYMESRRTSGSPSSLRMDEPMTMRNVPKEHQSRFLSDMEVIDTSPQVIAAGDYPGFDGRGYLDLYFAGDIYRNYDIHRHTVYHILPDRMVKLSIYNAVQPVRRPILDVMYFKVNGSEGINRWGGTENLPYGGEIILNQDVTSSIPAKPNITGKSDFPQVPGQEFPKEEVTQAVPVVYTDGRKQDVRGRYYLAYENDNVAMYPAEDAVSAPLPKEASVSRENRRTLRIPWQGGEGEYHVAYADGIVQIYPENETAYRLVQAKGRDEQLLLERSLTSAVRELGVQLEGIDAIYIYTK